jgi:hypothetical protein
MCSSIGHAQAQGLGVKLREASSQAIATSRVRSSQQHGDRAAPQMGVEMLLLLLAIVRHNCSVQHLVLDRVRLCWLVAAGKVLRSALMNVPVSC